MEVFLHSVDLGVSFCNSQGNTYLLITKFQGRTVNYGPRFSPSIYGPSAKRAGHKSNGKNKGP